MFDWFFIGRPLPFWLQGFLIGLFFGMLLSVLAYNYGLGRFQIRKKIFGRNKKVMRPEEIKFDFDTPEGIFQLDERYDSPPCLDCGAKTKEEAEKMCICGGDKDDCHGCHLWPD